MRLGPRLRGLAVVLVLPVMLILVSHSPAELLRAVGDAFARERESLPVSRLMDGAVLLASMGRYALASGVMGTFWACCAGLQALAVSDRAVDAHAALMISPWVGQALFMPAAGCFLRWFVFGPLSEALKPEDI